jgi:hypothetical protein
MRYALSTKLKMRLKIRQELVTLDWSLIIGHLLVTPEPWRRRITALGG